MEDHESNRQKRVRGSLLLAILLLALAGAAAGCASSEDVSSMPWAEPESWEQRPNMGVPY